MITDTLHRIETLIQKHQTLTETERQELKALSVKLRHELNQLANTHVDDAQTIASFANVAAVEALRPEQRADLYALAETGLQKSIEQFEDSHPQLFTTIKAFLMKLSGIGV